MYTISLWPWVASIANAIALLLLPLAAVGASVVCFPFLRLLWRQARSPLRKLPGPLSPSWFLGNLMEMHDQENNNVVTRWTDSYGSAFVYKGFVGGCRLMLTDERAVGHVLGNAYDYPKPDFVRDSLATMAAGHEGLLTVEGEVHRRQRKILNPAFSSATIRAITPIFWEKAVQLRHIWTEISDSSSTSTPQSPAPTSLSPPKPLRTDVLHWLTRAALDVIGLAGFGYSFDALESADRVRKVSTASSRPVRAASASAPSRRKHERTDSDVHYPPSQPFRSPFSPNFPTTSFRRRRKAPASPSSASSCSSASVNSMPTSPTSPPPFSPDSEKGYGTADQEAVAPSPNHGEEAEEENELAQAFSVIFSTARRFRVLVILQVWFPFLRRFRRNSATEKRAQETMRRIGLGLIKDKRAALEAEAANAGSSVDAIEGDTTKNRDLLSVLMRSSMAESPASQLSTEEIFCQISTFIAAGHETTSNALSWTLYALTRNPEVQRKLRAELRTVPLPSVPPSEWAGLTEEVNRLPYLDAVVRESLRLNSPVSTTMRVCARDDVIPLDTPLRDKNGRWRGEVEVKAQDIISIPIQAINKSERVWGEDAGTFRPERWEHLPEAARTVPGLYANTLTFLNGNPVNGNRACIGWKFALTEIKIFLFVLLRDLEFGIDPAVEIEKKVNVVTRPFVKSEPELGNQMPLYITRPSSPEDGRRS